MYLKVFCLLWYSRCSCGAFRVVLKWVRALGVADEGGSLEVCVCGVKGM